MAKNLDAPVHTSTCETTRKHSIRIDGAELERFLRDHGVKIPETMFSIRMENGDRNTLIFEWTETTKF